MADLSIRSPVDDPISAPDTVLGEKLFAFKDEHSSKTR